MEVTSDLTKEEKETLNKCVEFINLNSTLHANVGAMNKAIQKKITTINSLMDAREKLYGTCK